jgi:tryptophan 2,3-dioxygenase
MSNSVELTHIGGDGGDSMPGRSMTYSDYLSLSSILSAQHLRSGDHNEMLFIVQHQTSELWMKLLLHELRAVAQRVRDDELGPAFALFGRVTRIVEQLIRAWDVLATMTPSDYSLMRPHLGKASGFQSHQYRRIEFLLGNKNAGLVESFIHQPDAYDLLRADLQAPSLYDQVVFLLAHRGFAITDQRLDRDWSLPVAQDHSVERAWLEVYRRPSIHGDLYLLAEKLVDLEDALRQWRFRHVTTVERMIGFDRGTGGTSGVFYLRKMLDVVLFPELWQVRTALSRGDGSSQDRRSE